MPPPTSSQHVPNPIPHLTTWLQLPINVLGDVVISLDTAGRQAAERGYGLLDESRVLLVHGVLHLLGYDHEEGEWACPQCIQFSQPRTGESLEVRHLVRYGEEGGIMPSMCAGPVVGGSAGPIAAANLC